jgi:inner membrane protein
LEFKAFAMDPLEHVSIPSLIYLSLVPEPGLAHLLVLIAGATFPDIDALSKEHRSYLHSVLPILPLLPFSGNGYITLFLLGWLTHLFLDFFTGPVPLLYPLSRLGLGVSIKVRTFKPYLTIKVIRGYPEPKKPRELEVGGSFALALLTLLVLLVRLYF